MEDKIKSNDKIEENRDRIDKLNHRLNTKKSKYYTRDRMTLEIYKIISKKLSVNMALKEKAHAEFFAITTFVLIASNFIGFYQASTILILNLFLCYLWHKKIRRYAFLKRTQKNILTILGKDLPYNYYVNEKIELTKNIGNAINYYKISTLNVLTCKVIGIITIILFLINMVDGFL